MAVPPYGGSGSRPVFPLHRISYCADDKADKRMLTFIAKHADNNTHNCFVFDSDKCVSFLNTIDL